MKAKTVTQLTLMDSIETLVLLDQTQVKNLDPYYRCRPTHRVFNEWGRGQTDIEDCSRHDIAKSYRLGRGY